MQVRSAGDDAWLGGPAPEDPALDAVDESHAAGLALARSPSAAAPGAITPGEPQTVLILLSVIAPQHGHPGRLATRKPRQHLPSMPTPKHPHLQHTLRMCEKGALLSGT